MEAINKAISIDFIGPPGVGKSTLINALGLKSDRFLSRSSIVNHILRIHFKKQKLSVNDTFKQVYFYFNNQIKIAGVDQSKLKGFYFDHFNQHRGILMSAYEKLSKQSDQDEIVKEKRIQLLFDVLKHITLFQYFSDKSYTGLFDDSLSNMLLLTVLPENISDNDFIKWSQDKKFPQYTDGVVSLVSDRDTLMARLKSRKRVNTAHTGLSEEELKIEVDRQIFLYKRTTELLKLIDIPLLELNSFQSLDLLLKDSKQFIDTLRMEKAEK